MDQALIRAMHGIAGRSPILDATIAACASILPYFFVAAFIVAFFALSRRTISDPFIRRAERLRAALAIVSGLLVLIGIVIPAIRLFHASARPFAVFGWKPLIAMASDAPSFPSGHATFLFFLAAFLWQGDPRRGWQFAVAAAANAAARGASGVPRPSAVLFGALLGILGAIIVRRLLPPLHDAKAPGI